MRITKRHLVLVLVLCMVFLCAGCAKNITFAQYCKDRTYTDPYPTINSMTKIDLFTGMQASYGYNELVSFKDDQWYKIYNYCTAMVIADLEAESVQSLKFFSVNGKTFFAVQEVDGVTIHDASGKQIAKGNGSLESISAKMDLFQFDGSIYRVNSEGNVSLITSSHLFGGIPSMSQKTDNYYYYFDDSSVTVYDQDLNVIFFWEAPYSDADECQMTLMGDNVLVQMAIPLPESEDDYDCLIDGEKFNLESVVLNPAKDSATSVKLDYAVYGNLGKDYVAIAKIENRRVQDAPSAIQYVTLNPKNGKIASYVFSDLDGTAYMIAEDRFLYTAASGNTYLLNAKGETIGKINASGATDNRNACFFVYDGVIYNYQLQEVCDFGEYSTVAQVMGHSIALQKNIDSSYFLVKRDGSTLELDATAQRAYFTKQTYALKYDGYINVYNEDGTLIGSNIEGSTYQIVCSYDDTTIVKVFTSANGYTYYKLSK